MYFSSLFPYVVLACFLVRGLLLRGAVDGILHMFTPKVRVWGHPQLRWSWSAPCSESLREDLPCVRPQWDAGDGAWALPSGLQGEVQRIHLGEIRSFREDVTRESRLREQKGFQ